MKIAFQPVDPENIITNISNMKNKSFERDNISNKIIKSVCHEIAKPLSLILNLMYSTCISPNF